MIRHMELIVRTTLTIEADVLSEFKRLAADTHRTLSGVIEDALREQLARRRALGATAGADLAVVRGGGLLAGVDLTSNAVVQRLLDDGLPLEKLR
jgi:predicted transcriptional regulator